MNHFPLRYFQVVLFLLAAVPCGIPFRYQPNPVFPSELAALFGAAFLILGAMFLAPRTDKRVSLPWASLIWFALACVLGLQILVLPVPYLSEHTVPMLYLLTAGLSVWSLARAKAEFGSEPLMLGLAFGLVAGTLFNSGVGATQVVELFQHGFRIIYGHIGQRNMYGHYLAWGLAALAWLASERKLPQWAFWPIAVWLALSMAWSGSRSVFLYALAWLPLAGYTLWCGRDNVRRFGLFLGASALLMIAMQYVAPLINDLVQALLHSKNEVPTGAERMAANGSRRLVEWSKAWMVFKDHPIIGVGWGAFAYHSVALHVLPDFAKVQESVLFTHSHNSLLNLLAETGTLGAGVVVAGLVWLYAGLWRNWKNTVVLVAATMAAVSILHSLVEYPLWYYHLFGPFVLMLVFLRDDGPSVPISGRALPVAFVVCAGGLFALAVYGGMLYKQIYPIMDASSNPETNARNMTALSTLRYNPLLDYHGEYALSNYIVASEKDMPWKLNILRKINKLRPYPGQLTDQAVLEALSGNAEKAHQLMRMAVFAYPESFDYFYQTLHRFQQAEVRALLQEVEEGRQFFNKPKPLPPAEASKVSKGS